MEPPNLIFSVMAIVSQICLRNGVAQAITVGSHRPGLLWDATSPAGPSSGRTSTRHHLIRAAVRSLLLARRR
jgi:hypothetical protein